MGELARRLPECLRLARCRFGQASRSAGDDENTRILRYIPTPDMPFPFTSTTLLAVPNASTHCPRCAARRWLKRDPGVLCKDLECLRRVRDVCACFMVLTHPPLAAAASRDSAAVVFPPLSRSEGAGLTWRAVRPAARPQVRQWDKLDDAQRERMLRANRFESLSALLRAIEQRAFQSAPWLSPAAVSEYGALAGVAASSDMKHSMHRGASQKKLASDPVLRECGRILAASLAPHAVVRARPQPALPARPPPAPTRPHLSTPPQALLTCSGAAVGSHFGERRARSAPRGRAAARTGVCGGARARPVARRSHRAAGTLGERFCAGRTTPGRRHGVLSGDAASEKKRPDH